MAEAGSGGGADRSRPEASGPQTEMARCLDCGRQLRGGLEDVVAVESLGMRRRGRCAGCQAALDEASGQLRLPIGEAGEGRWA